MEILDDLSQASLRQETILAIGAFDGVHRGHQALIGQVVARARASGRLAGLITFHPHPVTVLAPDRAPRYLTTPGEKVALLERLGLDLVVLLPFTRETAATTAREFMVAISNHLRLRELWIGADFALGHNREGTPSRLRELGVELGYEVRIVEPVSSGDEVISSSRIRALLRQGQVEEATRLLGRYPSLSGEVVTGAHRGHKLGFPTANLEVRLERAVPADGIYAVFAVLGQERLPAVANVGVRPSFDNGQRIVEAYIFDFDRDIYGCDLVIEFVARLREERRFDHIDDLIAQIERDGEQARCILSDVEQSGMHRAENPDAADVGCRYHFREIEHTADRALQVWGQELPDLFAGAARGMYSLMGDLGQDSPVPTTWCQVSLSAMDRETLLVDWLNELLYLTEAEGVLFVSFQIESLTETALKARAGGFRPRAGAGHGLVTKADIKATTFHNLQIVPDEAGWSTVITFDV
jgi:riboflavin kinase/FMN adenylyltransferase